MTESAAELLTPQDAARALIGILDDESARSRLIGELGRIAATPPAEGTAEGTGAEPLPGAEEADGSFAGNLGVFTQTAADRALEIVERVGTRLANIADLWNGTARIDWPSLVAQLWSLALVAAVAFGVLFVARLVLARPQAALDRAAASRGILARLMLIAAFAAIELLALAGAWATALFATAALAAAGSDEAGYAESLFTNAFLFVEAVKIGIATVLMPRRPALRLLPLSDPTARYWTFWIGRLIDVLGYGMLLVIPVVNRSVSFAVGLGLRLVLVMATLLGGIALVVLNRSRVRDGLVAAAAASPSATVATILALVAPVWHMLVIGYALVAFLVWITRPFDAVGFMASATLQSAAILFVGSGLMALISRAGAGGLRLPGGAGSTSRIVQDRLNLFVPTLLRVLRILTGVAILLGVLRAWRLIDPFAILATEAGSAFLGRIAAAATILFAGLLVWVAATAWIEHRLRPSSGRVSTPRARTLLSLFRNALTIVVVVIAGMLALSELGVDIAPLIAGAGVIGLAVGFGSQKLVQDIITGAFIQLENAMNEGEVVTAAGISGVVERLTIRSVGLRDLSGVYHIIPFSSVDSVSNFMRGFSFHLAELRISAREEPGEVKRLMGEAFDRLMQTEHRSDILEPLEMHGVVDFIETAVVYRARIKTLPGKQWGVGRAYNEIAKAVFNEHDILLPAPPSSVLLHGDLKSVATREEIEGEDRRGAPPRAPGEPAT